MSVFKNFFQKKLTRSVVLIDIGVTSVAGAYVHYTRDKQPVLLYTRRLPIEIRKGESRARAMLRALVVLGDSLIRDGAPALMRATGNGSVDSVLISVDAPWQKISIRTEYFEQETPFTFDKRLVDAALKKTSAAASDHILVDESVIGTILNGYETRNPYGKLANRASVIVLTSHIDERVADSVQAIVKSLYHTKNIVCIAGSSLRYQAIRKVFPHERDVLILDATDLVTSIELVRKNLLVDVVEIASHGHNAALWPQKVITELSKLAERFPLPRMIFLLAHESETLNTQEILDETNLNKLWLSDNPPKIVNVMGSNMTGLIRQTSVVRADLTLILMALYWEQRAFL